MNFGEALELIKNGKRLARTGWNGFARKDWNAESQMFVFLVQGSKFIVNRKPLTEFYPEGTEITYHAHIDMKTAQGYVVPWLASQTDLLSDDWELME